MTRLWIGTLTIGLALAGCSGETKSAEKAEAPAPQTTATAANTIPMTNLQPTKIGPYDVQAMYEEKLTDGHFNVRVTGGEVAAVREWVGPEDASGVMVVKTEIENDYHHGHVEMPNPIPADTRLWIEIESPNGERHKGSVALN